MAHLSAIIHDAKKIILQPFDHISQNGTEKRNVMASMWRAFNLWYDCPKDKRIKMATLLDNSWSVSYLMDDIVDGGVLRRGDPTAHLIFGLPHTIYGIIYSTLNEFEKIFEFKEHKEKLTDTFIQMCLDILQNQTMTMYYRGNLICPNYQEYSDYLCSNAWITFCLQLLQVYGTNKFPDFPPTLKGKIGMFVQAYNDYINLRSPKYSKMRFFCEDVTEGKFTFLAIHAVQTRPEDERVLEILKQKSADIEVKKRYLSILNEFGTFEFTKKTLKLLRDEIFEGLERFYGGKNSFMEKTFNEVVNSLENDDAIYMDVCSKCE